MNFDPIIHELDDLIASASPLHAYELAIRSTGHQSHVVLHFSPVEGEGVVTPGELALHSARLVSVDAGGLAWEPVGNAQRLVGTRTYSIE